MRYLLLFWVLPLSLFWGWYHLSYHDMNFGYLMLSRVIHDYTFNLYGSILGIDPSTIGPLVARATVIDSAIVLSIFAFRRRRQIRTWIEARRHPQPRAELP